MKTYDIEEVKLENDYLKVDNKSLKAENQALQNKLKELEFKYNELFLKYAEVQNKLMETGTQKIIYKEKRMEGEITQWEYKTTFSEELEKLDNLGKEGWELTGVTACPGGQSSKLIFKRPKQKTTPVRNNDFPGYGR